MRAVTVTVTRNDADILEAFVRHHADFAHKMVIFIHRCSDNSAEIGEALVREGLPVEFHEYTGGDGDTTDTRRSKKDGRHTLRVAGFLTRTIQEIAKRLDPDWVLPLDTDEFVTAREGSTVTALAGLDPGRVVRIERPSYIPTHADDQAERHVLRRIVHRRPSDLPLPRAFIPGALARRSDFKLGNGSHFLLDASDEILPMASADEMFIGHFPVRSDGQLRSKIIGGYLAVSASPLPTGAHQWRRLFERCASPRPLTPEELSQIALFYPQPPDSAAVPELILDPIPTPAGDLRYEVTALEPWQVLVDSAVHLAEEVNRLASERMAGAARTGLSRFLTGLKR